MLQRTLNVRPEGLPSYYQLDYEALSEAERGMCEMVLEIFNRLVDQGQKDQKCGETELDWGRIAVTDDERTMLEAYSVIFRRCVVSTLEFSRRHPIH
ncbi:MAG: hypothetical protein WCC63_07020 [Candidatus Bathyarchaeia archaeon]